MHFYPAVPRAVASVSGDGEVPAGLMVAVRASDLVSPLRNGAPLKAGDRSALVIAGTRKISTGGPVVFCKVVAVAPAQVRRDGQVQAKGSPCAHATLGPLEEAVLGKQFVKGERERLLTAAFMIRAIVLMTLMPGAGISEVIAALAGDLALVPRAKARRPTPERACGNWRNALGPEPLEELRAIVLHAAWREA